MLVTACDPEILNSVFSNMWIQEATETIQSAPRKIIATKDLSQNTEKPQAIVKQVNQIENAPKVKEISDAAQKAIADILSFASDQKKDHLKNRLEKIRKKQTDIDRPRLVAGFDINIKLDEAEERKKTATEA